VVLIPGPLFAQQFDVPEGLSLRVETACLCTERTWLSNFLRCFLLIILETLSCRSRKFARLEWAGLVSHIPAIWPAHDQKLIRVSVASGISLYLMDA
jgi:hypothetical protein